MTDLLRDASKKNYSCNSYPPTHEELRTGCLQRIADATELMAENYQALIDERDKYKRWYNRECAESDRLSRCNAALRGVVTKLKRRS